MLFAALGAASRAEATSLALRLGLLNWQRPRKPHLGVKGSLGRGRG